jgi:tight adherence protein C
MTTEMLILALAVGTCASLGAYVALVWLEARAARRRFADGEGEPQASTSMIDTMLKPVFSALAPLFRGLRLKGVRAALDRKFAQAAIDTYTHEEFWAFQCFSTALFMVFLFILGLELGALGVSGRMPWWLYAVAAVSGFFFPYLWLGSLVKSRHERIKREFAGFVTNLTLTVEAGLDFISAVTRIARGMKPSPLREELSRMLSEIQLGSSRSTALRGLAGRVGVPEVSTFALVLIQADRFGTSIGQVLRAQAARLRRERFEAAERKGALASQKLLFPLVFFIMPSVFIVVFGPIIVKLLTEGLGGLFM